MENTEHKSTKFNPLLCKMYGDQVEKLTKIIDGNGNEGLKSKVARSYTATKINLGISCMILLFLLKGCAEGWH